MNNDTKVRDMVAWVQSHCVHIPRSEFKGDHLFDLIEWCSDNCGERRLYHPLYEAMEGWMDYFDGDWAYDDIGDDSISFWFSSKKHQAMFALRWL